MDFVCSDGKCPICVLSQQSPDLWYTFCLPPVDQLRSRQSCSRCQLRRFFLLFLDSEKLRRGEILDFRRRDHPDQRLSSSLDAAYHAILLDLRQQAALFWIKVFESILVAGAIALAARWARLLWILLFAVLPTLYSNGTLIKGTEAAAALFMLRSRFFTLSLFAREPSRWKWSLAITVFLLPPVRLEYVAISVTATAALCLLECSERKESLAATSLNRLVASTRSLNSAIPFAGACAGILTYSAY